MSLILLVIVGLLAVFLLLALVSPLLISAMSRLSPGPKNRQQAVKNGRELIAKSRTIVAVGAHPDDIEWYTGGTLAALKDKGARIIAIMVTDGGNLSKERKAEQLEAARIIGYEKVVFLGYPDASLQNQSQDEISAKIAKVYEQYKPDTVITFDSFDQAPVYHHPDHIAAGKQAVSAAKRMDIENVYLFHSGSPDTWVDISEFIELKAKAREAHKTQNKWWLLPFRMGDAIRRSSSMEGQKAGLDYAESFRKF